MPRQRLVCTSPTPRTAPTIINPGRQANRAGMKLGGFICHLILVPIFVPGRTYEHAALPDCEDTAVVIFAFALALIKEYGAALDEYEFFPESD